MFWFGVVGVFRTTTGRPYEHATRGRGGVRYALLQGPLAQRRVGASFARPKCL